MMEWQLPLSTEFTLEQIPNCTKKPTYNKAGNDEVLVVGHFIATFV